ncbi:MAG: ribosomal protein S18 acetylase RimI-like enzyme [Myxococcota bacterium]|jgi:ribosomal protein S18 acetylase RimI-like enzyme
MPAFRTATPADLSAIVALLADDPLGQTRESPGDPAYAAALDAILANPEDQVLLAVDGAAILGTLQLTFLPGLSRTGMWRAQIEGVRVARSARGQGVGRALMLHAIERSKLRGCGLVQLTTDATRVEAHRFYEGLGFVGSHAGMKLSL